MGRGGTVPQPQRGQRESGDGEERYTERRECSRDWVCVGEDDERQLTIECMQQ